MNNNDTIIRQYMNDIRKQFFHCHIKDKKYLSELEHEVTVFGGQTNSLSYEQLAEQFGQPSELASDYLSDGDSNHLKKKLTSFRRVRMMITVTVVLALICFLGYHFMMNMLRVNFDHSYENRKVIEKQVTPQ